MSTIHVQRGVQFKPELYKAKDRGEWFKSMGAELATRKLTITVGPGIEIKNADDAVNLYKRYQSDKAGLAAAIALPAGTTIENYVADLIQALDDCVKSTTNVTDKKLDFGPTSEMGKLLGMDSKSTYASKTTQFGGAPAGQTFSVLGIQMSKAAAPVDPLKDKVFMDATTFAAMPSYQWARDSVELETVKGVSGADPMALLDALRTANSAGKTTYQKLRKNPVNEAFTVGYQGIPLDEVKWDSAAHAMREKNKFVSLTVESGRFDADPATGLRAVSLGTDKMDDTYYDTGKNDLLKNEYEVRARARWDTDTEIRRILVGVKANTTIDEFGLKRCDKVDVRNDGAKPEEIAALDTDTRSGKTHWGGREEAVKPLKGLYDGLNAKGVLPDIGGHKGVLMLEPKIHVRSVRSRFHLNETDLSSMQKMYKDCSTPRLQAVLDQAAKVKGTLTGADLKSVTDLEAATTALMDNSAVAKAAEKALKELDPAMTVNADAIKALLPDLNRSSYSGGASDQLTIDKKRVVASAVDQAFHAYATQLDGARRALCGAQDRALENHPPFYMEYAQSLDKGLLNKTTYDAFLGRFDQVAAKPAADQAADLKGFNDFCAKQKSDGNKDYKDFKPLDDKAFAALRPQLLNEVVRVNERQLEAAGSMANALWFDEARAFYVPGSTRNTGNFLIDTMDYSEYVKHADWEAIPADQRTPKNQIPREKIFNCTLMNETQIELGLEKPYLDRMTKLSTDIHTDQASLVMKYLAANNAPGLNPADGASYIAAFQAINKLGKPELTAELAKINAFLVAQKSGLEPLKAETLGRMEASMFTPTNRDRAVRTDASTERALAGARFVFEQYRDIQEDIVKAKGERVLKVLKDSGLNGLDWKQTPDSKGNMGLKMLAGMPA
jgi:hypothetical protein